ncbi:MAG: hypothetical protein ABFR75_06890, partial [Acidobacteriota bacterium]
MKFELFIAKRYLLKGRKNSFISTISIVSTIGIAIGVAALIIALALINGFQSDIRGRILYSTAHIMLNNIIGYLVYGYSDIIEIINLFTRSEKELAGIDDIISQLHEEAEEIEEMESSVGEEAQVPRLLELGRKQIAVGADRCRKRTCPLVSTCFSELARKRAGDAELLIVNHALYFADLALRGADGDGTGVLPDHDAVIFDEAHRLEEAAATWFGGRVSLFG